MQRVCPEIGGIKTQNRRDWSRCHRLDQQQGPPHPRSLSRQQSDKSYRLRPHPPISGQSPVSMLLEDGLLDAGAEIIGPAGSVEADCCSLRRRQPWAGCGDAAVLDINLQGAAVSPVADYLAALGVPFIFVAGYDEDCAQGPACGRVGAGEAVRPRHAGRHRQGFGGRAVTPAGYSSWVAGTSWSAGAPQPR